MLLRLYYHTIWSTLDRKPLIQPAWEKDLYSFLGARAQTLGCVPHAINGTSTHVHLVLSIPPQVAVTTVIAKLKGASAHRLTQAHPEVPFAWQTDYALFTISETALERLTGYVKAQKQHHAGGTLIAAFEQTEA